jgi:hypothetical protein
MNTISKISTSTAMMNTRVKKANEQTQSITSPQISQDEFVNVSPSFKGKYNLFKAPNKSMLSIITAFFSALGLKGAIDDVNPEQQLEMQYGEAFAENSELVDGLENSKEYSKAAIITLVKYNKENPEFALDLSDYLKNNNENDKISTIEIAERIAKEFKENKSNLSTISKLVDNSPNQTYKLLQAQDINTGLAKKMINQSINRRGGFNSADPDRILGFAKLSKEYPVETMSLVSNPYMQIEIEDAKILAPYYYAIEDTMNDIFKLLHTSQKNAPYTIYNSHDAVDLYNSYTTHKDTIVALVSKKMPTKHILKSIENYELNPKLFEEALNENEQQGIVFEKHKDYDGINKFVSNAEILKPAFEKIAKDNKQAQLSLKEKKMLSDAFQGRRGLANLNRIFADNRGTSVNEILKLAPIYNEYTCEITDFIIKKETNPIGKYFG